MLHRLTSTVFIAMKEQLRFIKNLPAIQVQIRNEHYPVYIAGTGKIPLMRDHVFNKIHLNDFQSTDIYLVELQLWRLNEIFPCNMFSFFGSVTILAIYTIPSGIGRRSHSGSLSQLDKRILLIIKVVIFFSNK